MRLASAVEDDDFHTIFNWIYAWYGAITAVVVGMMVVLTDSRNKWMNEYFCWSVSQSVFDLALLNPTYKNLIHIYFVHLVIPSYKHTSYAVTVYTYIRYYMVYLLYSLKIGWWLYALLSVPWDFVYVFIFFLFVLVNLI